MTLPFSNEISFLVLMPPLLAQISHTLHLQHLDGFVGSTV